MSAKAVAAGTTVERGHAIAHEVEAKLRAKYSQVADIVVHVEPPGSTSSEPEGTSG